MMRIVQVVLRRACWVVNQQLLGLLGYTPARP